MGATAGEARVPHVAVVGGGYWGKNIVRVMARLGALARVVDTDPERAASLAGEHGATTASFEEVLADPGVTALAIATPAVTHAELARRALEAGKHVFVEKPLALVPDDAAALIASAWQHDRLLMVGHLLQYHPAFERLLQLIGEGELGRIDYLYSNRLNLGKFRREENALWSFAPHDISMILAIAGEVPAEVSAVGGSYLRSTVADVTTTHLRFPGGARAHVFVSWLHPVKEQRLVVVGDRGMAVFDDLAPWPEKLLLYRHGVTWRDGAPLPDRAEAERVEVAEDEPLTRECAHFLDSIVTGVRPRTDGAEGLAVLRVLDAAQRSMERDGVPVALSHTASPPFEAHPTAVVDPGVTIGAGTKIWHFCHVTTGASIGSDCSLGQNVMVAGTVTIGNRCRIQNNVSLYDGVHLADDVFCGPSCVFTNVLNPRAHVSRKDEYRPTEVERGVTIGANATIVCGNTLGAYSFVAAGAVVTSDVRPHALVAGVPARQIGWMSHDGERLGADLRCPRSGRQYAEVDGDLQEIGTQA